MITDIEKKIVPSLADVKAEMTPLVITACFFSESYSCVLSLFVNLEYRPVVGGLQTSYQGLGIIRACTCQYVRNVSESYTIKTNGASGQALPTVESMGHSLALFTGSTHAHIGAPRHFYSTDLHGMVFCS